MGALCELKQAPPVNLTSLVLRENNYMPYLPKTGYTDTEDKEYKASRDWKMKADRTTTPTVIEGIYNNLLEQQYIPSYEKNFTIVSNGCNIPTYERLIFDLDREKRKGQTRVFSVDLLNIPQSILSTLTVGGKKDESCHQFIHSEEDKFSPGEKSVDMILNYRASLYYYLEYIYRGAPELLNNASFTLKKYYSELRENGCVVVDAADHIKGKDAETEMYKSTGELLIDFQEELVLDKLYYIKFTGKDKTRVMVLKKKN